MEDVQKTILDLLEQGTLLSEDAYLHICTEKSPLSPQLPKGLLSRDALISANTSGVEIRKTKKIIAKDFECSTSCSYVEPDYHEKTTDSFVDYFCSKHEQLKGILLNHQECRDAVSISNAAGTQGQEATIICMVYDIFKTKSGSLMAEVEDGTGRLRVFFKGSAAKEADRIMHDDVIGLRGRVSKDTMSAEAVIWPDVPRLNENKIADPLSAVFISDLHHGSKKFLPEVQEKFLGWLRSGEPDAARVKYLFIAGDIADGIGIYAGQEEDLTTADIFGQYRDFERLFERIPDHISVIVCAGNHDAVGLAEPQAELPKKFLPNIHGLRNLHLTQNPANVSIHQFDGSRGLNVLMYHGYSFTSVIDAVPELRHKGMSNPQHVMEDVLRRRHLAPSYGSTIVNPMKSDPLVIGQVPDIFHTGDLHSHAAGKYRGITTISSSTFQGQTKFMDRVGHKANPGKITCVELDTRRVSVMGFYP